MKTASFGNCQLHNTTHAVDKRKDIKQTAALTLSESRALDVALCAHADNALDLALRNLQEEQNIHIGHVQANTARNEQAWSKLVSTSKRNHGK